MFPCVHIPTQPLRKEMIKRFPGQTKRIAKLAAWLGVRVPPGCCVDLWTAHQQVLSPIVLGRDFKDTFLQSERGGPTVPPSLMFFPLFRRIITQSLAKQGKCLECCVLISRLPPSPPALHRPGKSCRGEQRARIVPIPAMAEAGRKGVAISLR